MKTGYMVAFTISGMLFAGTAQAGGACLYGSARWSSGSEIDGSTRVTTSWNSKKAYPRNGEYELCYDRNPDRRVTVYVQGRDVGDVYLDGNTRFDVVRRK